MRYAVCCTVLVLTLLRAVAAQDNIHRVTLTITPAARPVPVMRYRLNPAARELTPGNAASFYYRAIVVLQSLDMGGGQQGDADTALNGDWLDLPLQELPLDAAKQGLERWATSLNEIELGAGRAQAIWDLPLREQGIATQLQEIQEIRKFARLLALRARVEIAEGRFNDAAATLRTLLRMAQHVSESGTLISSLVGVACQAIAFSEVEEWIGAPDSPNLYWALTSLPNPPIDISTGLESEHFWFGAEIPYLDLLETSTLSEAQSQELFQRTSQFLAETTEPTNVELPGGLKVPSSWELTQVLPMLNTYPSAKRELIARDRSAEEVERMPVAQVVVLRWLQEHRDLLDEMIAWGSRPYAESKPALAELDERISKVGEHPSGHFAALMLPAVGAARRAEVRLQQRVAFLRVIEALRLYTASHGGGLPASLSEITEVPVPLDPTSNQPFAYKLDGLTASLRSNTPQATKYDQRYEITVRK